MGFGDFLALWHVGVCKEGTESTGRWLCMRVHIHVASSVACILRMRLCMELYTLVALAVIFVWCPVCAIHLTPLPAHFGRLAAGLLS